MWNTAKHVGFNLLGSEAWLPGTWRRLDDEFADCVIAITEEGDAMRGVITVCPYKMKTYGWETGDPKWKDIKCVKKNTYTLQDLYKEYDRKTKLITRMMYKPATLRFIGTDTITVESGNKSQKWRRISVYGKKPIQAM